jgi:hypothetical protein
MRFRSRDSSRGASVLISMLAFAAIFKPRALLIAENLCLRQQLLVLQRRHPRPRLMIFRRSWAKRDQSIQDQKRRGRDNEHVDRATVSVRWLCRKQRQVGEGSWGVATDPPDRGLADIAGNSPWIRGAPQRVGRAHLADQVADFGTRLGSSRTAWSQSPVDAEALATPSDHGRRFKECQGIEELIGDDQEVACSEHGRGATWCAVLGGH